VRPVRRILIFNELGPSSPVIDAINQEILAGLEKSPYQIELYTEFLETTLFPDLATQSEFLKWYVYKYRNRKPDMIIAVGPSPIKFLVETHEKSFPNIPVVFCASTMEMADYPKLNPYFTGVWENLEPTRTLDVALKLEPNTKHLVVVGGVASYDRQIEAAIRASVSRYESRVDVAYLTDVGMPTLLERLKRLPKDTVVLYAGVSEDAAGTHYIEVSQSTPMVTMAADAPVFSTGELEVSKGVVGGYLTSYAKEADIVAADVMRILNGRKPQDIPIVTGANVYMFDWRVLKRWGLKESDLPPGSTIVNRDPSFWETYQGYVIAGIFVFLAQAVVIVGLLWQRVERRKARTELLRSNAQLRESEERFRLVANTAPVMIWMSGVDKLCTYFNQPWLEFTGRPLEAELGNGWAEGVHAEDLERCLETYTRAFDQRLSFWMQYRLRRHSGEYRWVLDHGVPRFGVNGSFAGYIGSCLDVTDRKLAEEALSKVSQKLIEAHEEERALLARELHDDIVQRLALLAVNLEGIKRNLPRSAIELRRQVEEAHNAAADLGNDVQTLSHQLHPSKLEILGLTKATTSFCKELSERQGVKVDFHAENVQRDLPKEVSLCLFRVLQEALHNAAKHSGVRHFEVSLMGRPSGIELTVHDSGIGVDLAEALKGQGIGLKSMSERLKLVSGELSVHSGAGAGTTIRAVVPLSSKMTAPGTAG
jgi:PAS domain S-box-containing protein